MCLLWILLILRIESCASTNSTDKEKLVVNGVGVEIEQYPYTAQVVINHSTSCGGALISRRIIATAGHCVYNSDDRKLTSAINVDVYLGSSSTMQGYHYDVCKVMKHPKYGNSKYYYYYDIALLLLTKNAKLNKKVQIAKIAPNHKWRNIKNTMTIAGFGYTHNTEDLPDEMFATRMHYVDSKICSMSQTGDGDYMPVPQHMFCMIGTTFTSDCFGDSGSPITWRSYIVGLVSHGRDSSCGSESMPSLYTDLTYFKSWLMDKVKELESTSSKECDEEEEERDEKERKYHEKLHVTKLMKLIPITDRTNDISKSFFKAWPIVRPKHK